MAKFHLNPNTGEVGRCVAEQKCAYAEIGALHFDSKRDATAASEQLLEATFGLVPPVSVATVAPLTEPQDPRVARREEEKRKLANVAASLLDQAEDEYRLDDADRLTMMETAQRINDKLTTWDWTDSTEAKLGREAIEDLQQDFQADATSADLAGHDAASRSYWRASEALGDVLVNLRSESHAEIERHLRALK